jgi:hypothetical protein
MSFKIIPPLCCIEHLSQKCLLHQLYHQQRAQVIDPNYDLSHGKLLIAVSILIPTNLLAISRIGCTRSGYIPVMLISNTLPPVCEFRDSKIFNFRISKFTNRWKNPLRCAAGAEALEKEPEQQQRKKHVCKILALAPAL